MKLTEKVQIGSRDNQIELLSLSALLLHGDVSDLWHFMSKNFLLDAMDAGSAHSVLNFSKKD